MVNITNIDGKSGMCLEDGANITTLSINWEDDKKFFMISFIIEPKGKSIINGDKVIYYCWGFDSLEELRIYTRWYNEVKRSILNAGGKCYA